LGELTIENRNLFRSRVRAGRDVLKTFAAVGAGVALSRNRLNGQFVNKIDGETPAD
jgi:hypothetical protein